MVEFYYGMSGTFKSITLDKRQKETNYSVCRSLIKTWKDMEKILGEYRPEYNDLNYALLHLCTLKNISSTTSDLLVERGVTDAVFYRIKKGFGVGVMNIKELVKKELEFCGDSNPEKILLINKDIDFIRDVILSEPHRRDAFPGGVEDYLREQEDYIKFTSEYNQITDVRTITNAQEYIESLGLKYMCKNY